MPPHLCTCIVRQSCEKVLHPQVRLASITCMTTIENGAVGSHPWLAGSQTQFSISIMESLHRKR